jgi:uncharacterized protein YndB with AHSA1/START domain
MTHEFKLEHEVEIEATPEQVWEAIATGPGVDSWFMGHTEFEPHVNGKGRWTMGDFTQESTVTAWEPARHLAYRGDENPDGTFMAFEYLIEGRDGGTTMLRLVHSGFLGEDWEAEYDALTKGNPMYLEKLAAYLKYFPGRTSTYDIFASRPEIPEDRAWAEYERVLGLTGTPAVGDKVRFAIEGIAPVDGVVEFASLPTFVGVRTDDGIYAFMHAMGSAVVVENHSFTDDVDHEATERAVHSWLATSFT